MDGNLPLHSRLTNCGSGEQTAPALWHLVGMTSLPPAASAGFSSEPASAGAAAAAAGAADSDSGAFASPGGVPPQPPRATNETSAIVLRIAPFIPGNPSVVGNSGPRR